MNSLFNHHLKNAAITSRLLLILLVQSVYYTQSIVNLHICVITDAIVH